MTLPARTVAAREPRLKQTQGRPKMAIARITELTSSSTKSFDDALQAGIKRATQTLENVSGAWIQDQEVVITDNRISEYRLRLKVTFVLKD
jgi:flavin-binding protein dodecin